MSPFPAFLSLRRRGRKATAKQQRAPAHGNSRSPCDHQSSRSQGIGFSKIVGLHHPRVVEKANPRTKAGVLSVTVATVAYSPNNGHDKVGPSTHKGNTKSPHADEAQGPPRGYNRSKAPIFARSAVANPRCRPILTVGNAFYGRPSGLASGETVPRHPLLTRRMTAAGRVYPSPLDTSEGT